MLTRLLSLLVFAAPLGAQSAMVLAGALLDPATGQLKRNQLIVIEAGKVTRVTDAPRGIVGTASAPLHDLSSFTVMPGLIDGHVHLAIGGPVRENAAADLRAGFTTVVDLGARTDRLMKIRDSINAGLIPGPRVLAAGVWIGRKNGVCEFNGIGIAGGPDAYAARAKNNIDNGAELTKVCLSGWPGESFALPDSVQMSAAELRAAVAESKQRGRPVVAHALSKASVLLALDGGVSGLAHAAFIDEALAARMNAASMFMMPTLASLTGGDSSAASRALIASTALAWKAGVRIVFGTDGGVLPHGKNAEELLALHAAGISRLDVLRAATVNAARAFGLDSVAGAIRPGLSADLIAIEGDPVIDLTTLRAVRFVMLRGQVVVKP